MDGFTKICWVLLGACLLVSDLLYANEFPINPADKLEDLRKQQELQESIQRETHESQQRHDQGAPALLMLSDSPETGPAFLIKEIDIIGMENGPSVNVQDILENYRNRKLGSIGLFNLIREVTNKFIEKGYSTTTISLLPGNMKVGQITLRVNWGLVYGWLINGHPPSDWRQRWMVETLIPGVVGEPLNIHDVDQAVESLSNGVKVARIDVVPGPQKGTSFLNVILQLGKAAKVKVGVNNANPESTSNGRYQLTFSTNSGDALLPNDRLSVSGGLRYFNERYGNDEYSGAISYAVPFGFSEISLRYSKYIYHKEIVGGFGSYGSNGSSDTYALRFGQTLFRSKSDKLSVSAELELADSTNYIEGRLIEVNSRPYRSLSLGSQYVTRLVGGSLYSDLSYVLGVSAFGGEPAAVDRHGQEVNVQKIQSNISWSKPFVLLEIPLDFSLRLSGQYSPQSMVSSYKMGIGNEYTVRGYRGTPAWGDTGILASSTLEHTFFPSQLPLLNGGSLSSYAGFDWGQVRDVSCSCDSVNTLSGLAFGLRTIWEHLSFGVGIGFPLKKLKENDLSEVVYLDIATSY